MDNIDSAKLEQFIKYYENTWIKPSCHFDRSVWNIYDQYSTRTNNISETYNHQINGHVMNPNSNIYKIMDVVKKQEALASTKYERVNLGKEKKSSNAQKTKDAQIALIKTQYKYGEVDMMDYLMKLNEFIQEHN